MYYKISQVYPTHFSKIVPAILKILYSSWLFHDGGRYHIETSPLICRTNQWTGFYMITASVMKRVKNLTKDISTQVETRYFLDFSKYLKNYKKKKIIGMFLSCHTKYYLSTKNQAHSISLWLGVRQKFDFLSQKTWFPCKVISVKKFSCRTSFLLWYQMG